MNRGDTVEFIPWDKLVETYGLSMDENNAVEIDGIYFYESFINRYSGMEFTIAQIDYDGEVFLETDEEDIQRMFIVEGVLRYPGSEDKHETTPDPNLDEFLSILSS